MHVDRTTIKNSSLGEHHMVWNAKTKLYTDDLKYRVQAIWNIYLLDAALPKEFSTVAVQEKKNYWGKRLLWAFKLLRNHILESVNFYFILFSFVTGEIYFGALMIFKKQFLFRLKWDLTAQGFLVILNLNIVWWVLLILKGFFYSLLNCKLAILPAI